MYKIPFQLLVNHLSQIEEIKAVQAYRGQDLIPGSLTTEPTVTVRFPSATTASIGNGIEEVDQQIELRIVTTLYSESETQYAPPAGHPDHDFIVDEINRSFIDKYFRLSDLAEFSALSGTDDDWEIMNSLQRTQVAFHEMRQGKLVTTLTYACQLYEYATVPMWQTVTVGFQVEEYEFIPPPQ